MQQKAHLFDEFRPSDNSLDRVEELCLIHHYATSTCQEISRSESEARIWRDTPIRDGTRYPFVLDAILALAALHKGYTTSSNSKKYMTASLYYQGVGLQACQQHLEKISSENCQVLFEFSSIINLVAIGMSRGGPGLSPSTSIETIFTIFKLSKGIRTILNTNMEVLLSGPYKESLTIPSNDSDAKVSEGAALAIAGIREQVNESRQNHHADFTFTYTATIDMLEEAFVQLEHYGNHGAVVSFAMSISEESVNLLKAHDPVMLLIFVHYGALFSYIHDLWWAHGFGARMVRELCALLHAAGAGWAPLTSWAMAKVTIVDRLV